MASQVRADIIPHTYGADYIKGTWGEPLSMADFGLPSPANTTIAVDFFYHDLKSSEPYSHVNMTRLTAFLTTDFGLSRRTALGFRLPFVRLSKTDGDTREGVGDLLIRLRTAVHRIEDDASLVTMGVGVKLPTGREAKRYDHWYSHGYSHTWYDLALTTDTYDLVIGSYMREPIGQSTFYGYLGVAFALADRGDGPEELGRTLTWEANIGIPIQRRTQFLFGMNGYSQDGTGTKSTFIFRIQGATNEARTTHIEGGFEVDFVNVSGLQGCGFHIGLSLGIGR